MTTYLYTVTVNVSESIALSKAIDLMLEKCELELAGGPKTPYWSYQQSLLEVKSRLHDQARQTSGNSLWNPL